MKGCRQALLEHYNYIMQSIGLSVLITWLFEVRKHKLVPTEGHSGEVKERAASDVSRVSCQCKFENEKKKISQSET